MTVVGPVCHIPPDTVADQPQPINIPAIPPAFPNIASLTATVNAMRQALQIIMGQNGSDGRQGSPGKQGFTNNAKGTWSEEVRVTERVRVYQNNNKNSKNWVDVDRINKLVMNNKDTGQKWSWDRNRK